MKTKNKPHRYFGQRIKALMHIRGFKSIDLARHCDVTRGAVANWFSSGSISKPNLKMIAAKLRTTTDRLLDYEVSEILELEEVDRQKSAKAIGPLLEEARRAKIQQQYSLAALEIALMYDQLPGELERVRATQFFEALLNRNHRPALDTALVAKPVPPPAAPSKRASVPPNAKPRRVHKTSRAKARS